MTRYIKTLSKHASLFLFRAILVTPPLNSLNSSLNHNLLNPCRFVFFNSPFLLKSVFVPPMETEGDGDYLSFLSHLSVSDHSFMLEVTPDGASSPIRVKYDEINPTPQMKPDRKRTRGSSTLIERGIEECDGERSEFGPDSVRLGKKRRNEKKEEGLSKRELVGTSVKVLENVVTKEAVSERVEVQSQQSTPLPEPLLAHLQVFKLLMEKLCPVEMTTYPGWNDENEGAISPTDEPSKSKNVEKTEELKSRHKGNKRGNAEIESIAAISEPSDSDEDPIMDIPMEVLSRPSSGYKVRLIKELKRPFDRCEYRELMKQAAHRNKKIVYKELRSMENSIETETAPRIRERAIELEEDSKSFFDWYPEVEREVEKARLGHRLTLLRGFFFWLQNCSWEESFEPWQKYHKEAKRRHKGAKRHLRNDYMTPG